MRHIIMLAPEHGGLKQYLTQTGIKNPQVRELDPRAGMRRFEISGSAPDNESLPDKNSGLIEQVLGLLRTSYQP